jgi:hypothetical protein
MPTVPRPFPAAMPHGALSEPLPGIFFVKGTMQLPAPVPMRFSRNMVIVQEGKRLVLINTVRLDESGLSALDALGKVTDVVRIAGNHGMDDPFYADRYKAKVWAVKGQRYVAGLGAAGPDVYFESDEQMAPGGPLPIEGATLHLIRSRPPEALLRLPQHGGVIVAGDCLQHWAKSDPYWSFPARIAMPLLGFVKPHNVGPAWFKGCKPPKEDLAAILDLPFSHVLPAHGEPVIDDAVSKYRPAIERLTSP